MHIPQAFILNAFGRKLWKIHLICTLGTLSDSSFKIYENMLVGIGYKFQVYLFTDDITWCRQNTPTSNGRKYENSFVHANTVFKVIQIQ